MTCLRCFSGIQMIKGQIFQLEKQPTKKRMHLCLFIILSFLHSFIHSTITERLFYYQTRHSHGPCNSRLDFRTVFAFPVPSFALKPASCLTPLFFLYVVKFVNRNFFYLLLSFSNLEAEFKTSLLILTINSFWILLTNRILELFIF